MSPPLPISRRDQDAKILAGVIRSHTGAGTAAALAPDGRRLAAAGGDRTARI
jgi:hypothetical protein